jgi:signal transduction histidine kinase
MKSRASYIPLVLIPVVVIGLIVFQLLWQQQLVEKAAREKYIKVLYALNRIKTEWKNPNSCVTLYAKPLVGDKERLILLKQASPYKKNADTVGLWLNPKELDTVSSGKIPLQYTSYESSLKTQVEVSMKIIYVPDSNANQPVSSDTLHPFHQWVKPEDMANLPLLHTLVKRELLKEGIVDSFGFAFRDYETRKIVRYYQVKDTSAIYASKYHIDLFRQDPFLRPQLFTLILYPTVDSVLTLTPAYLSIIGLLLLVTLLLIFYRFHNQQRKLSQIKSDFLHNMNHEMNTPITNIQLVLESLYDQEDTFTNGKRKALLDIAGKEVQRLQQNVDRSLQISLLEEKKIVLNKTKVNLTEAIQDVVSGFQPTLSKLPEVEIIQPMEEVFFETDRLHFCNLISALLDNAIKYRNPLLSLRIEIQIQQLHDQIQLIFSDNGIGMNAQVQKNVFEKFYRGESGLVHNTKGFGLGLSYVRTIVHLHGGIIHVNSKPNTGTSFEIHLPV